MLAAWRRPLAPLAHMPPSTPMMASRGTVSCVKVPPPTFISNVGGDTFTGAIVTRICFGCSSCTSGLRHPRDYTDCTVCRPGLGKPKMGLAKSLDQMRTAELLLLSVWTNTKLTRPLIKFQNGHRLEVLFMNVRDDFGFQRNDNMSLDGCLWTGA